MHGLPRKHAGSWMPDTDAVLCENARCQSLADAWRTEVLSEEKRTWKKGETMSATYARRTDGNVVGFLTALHTTTSERQKLLMLLLSTLGTLPSITPHWCVPKTTLDAQRTPDVDGTDVNVLDASYIGQPYHGEVSSGSKYGE